MAKNVAIVHHADRRTDVHMPYAPGIVVTRGRLVFLSGVTAAAVYHSHPHRDEEFDLPPTPRRPAAPAEPGRSSMSHLTRDSYGGQPPMLGPPRRRRRLPR